MTMPQLLHAMGIDKETGLTEAEFLKRAAEARAKAFDAICQRHGLQPAQLATKPAAEIADLIRQEGKPVPDESKWNMLTQWAAEYAAFKTNA